MAVRLTVVLAFGLRAIASDGFLHTPHSSIPSAALAVGAVFVGLFVYVAWVVSFSGKVPRSDASSPSHGQRPPLATEEERRSQLIKLGAHACSSVADAMSRGLFTLEPVTKQRSAEFRSTRRPSVLPGGDLRLPEDVFSKHADMDHIRMPFLDFVWCMAFIVPGSALLGLGGTLRKKLREALHAFGAVRQRPHDPAAVAGRLLLETSCVVGYVGTCQDPNGKCLASFAFDHVAVMDDAGEVSVAGLVTFEVDLDTKSVAEATFEKDRMTAKEALVMAWWLLAAHNHVKIHALANWAVNLQYHGDRNMQRMGKATVFYNYLGFKVFRLVCKAAWLLCIMRADYSRIDECFSDTMKRAIPPHGQLRELAKCSASVDFMIKVRNGFLNCFAEHYREFPAIDGEAFFVGTVMHSLDHAMSEEILKDVLWLDVDGVSSRFRGMADVGRLVRSGFVQDVPLVMFNRRFRDAAPDTFFAKVYNHAVRINQFLADQMDMCIIK